MSKQILYKAIFTLCPALILSSSFSVDASTVVTVNKSGNNITWQVSGNTYSIASVQLSVTGSSGTTTTLPGCNSSPLDCIFSFNYSGASIITSDFISGTYSWEVVIQPLINDSICNSTNVRDLQGGLQGLSGQGGSTPEDLYLDCLINSGVIPLDNQELNASGSFTIDGNDGLIVPDDTNPTPSDNVLPVALCADISIEGSDFNCSVYADVDNGSFDPDGSIESLTQSPDGPYILGVTSVILTVTDNIGDTSSCSANVTVTDKQAPEIMCPIANTMSPNTAPASFVAISTDTCSVPDTQVTSYDCYRYNPNGQRIDTNDSCVVSINSDGITVIETSGVNSFIDWIINAKDSVGNSSDSLCTVEVIHPNG